MKEDEMADAARRTGVCLRNDSAFQRRAVLVDTPCEFEVVRVLFEPGSRIDYVGLYVYILGEGNVSEVGLR